MLPRDCRPSLRTSSVDVRISQTFLVDHDVRDTGAECVRTEQEDSTLYGDTGQVKHDPADCFFPSPRTERNPSIGSLAVLTFQRILNIFIIDIYHQTTIEEQQSAKSANEEMNTLGIRHGVRSYSQVNLVDKVSFSSALSGFQAPQLFLY